MALPPNAFDHPTASFSLSSGTWLCLPGALGPWHPTAAPMPVSSGVGKAWGRRAELLAQCSLPEQCVQGACCPSATGGPLGPAGGTRVSSSNACSCHSTRSSCFLRRVRWRSRRDALFIHQLTAAYDFLIIVRDILGGFTEICMKQAMVPTATGGFATGMCTE